VDDADLAFTPLSEHVRLIADGEVSSRELVDLYLRRIERLDPALNATRVVWAERAGLEAAQADARRGAGDRRTLLGVPFLVKDSIDVAGEVTTSGTRARDAPASQDAEVVRRLRAAGAVLLGKTQTPELCMWPFTETSTFGITRNPWSLDRSPGGSSGGSAAAVAAGLASAALGSDGGGSIRIPAARCGLLGLKPQRGRVPLEEDEGAWNDLGVLGVLTRTVLDTALFLDAVADGAGPTPFAVAARAAPGKLRIAVARNVAPELYAPLRPANRAALDETAELLRSLGHEVHETRIAYGRPSFAACFLARYLRGIHDEAAHYDHPERFERRTRGMIRLGASIPRPVLAALRRREGAWSAALGSLLRDHDVLMTPTTPDPPIPVARYEGRGALVTLFGASRQVPYCTPWNFSGQPACSVPAGVDDEGLPRAVQLVGREHDEATLLSLAAQIEGVRPWAQRRPALAT